MSKAGKHPGQLYVVAAPSGTGKTSLVRALLASAKETGVAISHTTRPRRPDETDGINYHFVDADTFRAMVGRGEFLEWASVFGHLYGTSMRAASPVLDAGKDLILEIDWQGARQVREKMPATQSIFIFPPSLKALRHRLESRAQDDHATVEKRMAAAFAELSHYAEFDYLIVNDAFDTALAELQAIMAGKGDELRRGARLPSLQGLLAELLPQQTP